MRAEQKSYGKSEKYLAYVAQEKRYHDPHSEHPSNQYQSLSQNVGFLESAFGQNQARKRHNQQKPNISALIRKKKVFAL